MIHGTDTADTFCLVWDKGLSQVRWPTFGPYCFLVTTSGAIQYGVPTMVERLDCSGVICAQKPKSAKRKKKEWFGFYQKQNMQGSKLFKFY